VTSVDAEVLRAVAGVAAAAGAAVALEWQRHASDLHVEEKAASDDLVSQADREAEAAIRAVLVSHRPDDAIVGEETGTRAGTSGVCWLIDPIDGTTNYLYRRADWAVSVAAVDAADGSILAAVVAEPALARVTEASLGRGTWVGSSSVPELTQTDLRRALVDLNVGSPTQRPRFGAVTKALVGRVRDVRRSGSAAAALAQVATGRVDAAWLPGLQPWDCAAGLLLVAEAGGLVGDLAGCGPARLPRSGDVLAAPPALWEPLRNLLRTAAVA
jgi:myo-inositol-1(or 4)-monophosphatase